MTYTKRTRILLAISVIASGLIFQGCREDARESAEATTGMNSNRDAQVDAAIYDGVASMASEARPLIPGLQAPAFSISSADGSLYDFDPQAMARPVIIVFYRGGWCPYCNRQLSELRLVEDEIVELGYEMLFISADRAEILKPSLRDQTLDYTLLSDNEMKVARDFCVAFRVDDATIERYLSGGLDIEAASGRTHRILPIPAVFIIGSDGLIDFMYANTDYRVRIDPELLLAAAQLLRESES
jgi:peroxiredoxin